MIQQLMDSVRTIQKLNSCCHYQITRKKKRLGKETIWENSMKVSESLCSGRNRQSVTAPSAIRNQSGTLHGEAQSA